MLSEALAFLQGLPPAWIYLLLGIGAGVENIVPPVPADTFVVLGGFIAGGGGGGSGRDLPCDMGRECNDGARGLPRRGALRSAVLRYRPAAASFLRPHQLHRLGAYYRRWGRVTIFATRFLPGFRAVVPVFAGVTGQRFLPVALPLASASAIWYGLLVWVGTRAGRNVEGIVAWLGELNRLLLIAALALGAAVLYGWHRSRNAAGGRRSASDGR